MVMPALAADGVYAVSKIKPALLNHAHAIKRVEEIKYEIISFTKTRLYK